MGLKTCDKKTHKSGKTVTTFKDTFMSVCECVYYTYVCVYVCVWKILHMPMTKGSATWIGFSIELTFSAVTVKTKSWHLVAAVGIK